MERVTRNVEWEGGERKAKKRDHVTAPHGRRKRPGSRGLGRGSGTSLSQPRRGARKVSIGVSRELSRVPCARAFRWAAMRRGPGPAAAAGGRKKSNSKTTAKVKKTAKTKKTGARRSGSVAVAAAAAAAERAAARQAAEEAARRAWHLQELSCTSGAERELEELVFGDSLNVEEDDLLQCLAGPQRVGFGAPRAALPLGLT